MPTIEPTWWEVCFEVAKTLGDDAAAMLMSHGADGVEIVDSDNPPPPGEPGEDPKSAAPRRPSRADLALLVASFEGEQDAAVLVGLAQEALGDIGVHLDAEAFAVRQRNDGEWAVRWKQFFKPLPIGEHFTIVPSWETTFVPPQGTTVLNIDPGMAFGTGQHETTALCLEAIAEFMVALQPDQRTKLRVLDVGCGSGVLAIGAAKLGAQNVLAIDNDPEAVAIAHENVAENAVATQVDCSDAPLNNIKGPFDLVVANILASTLCELVAPMLEVAAAGTRFILSGILATQEHDVIACYLQHAKSKNLNLTHVETHRRGEWVAIVFNAGSV